MMNSFCRFTQEHVLRLAEVGPSLTHLHVDELLETAGTSSFHPLLVLPRNLLDSQHARIRAISDPKLKQQQQRDLDEVQRLRDEALKAHLKQHGSCNYPADIKAGTATIKALVVREALQSCDA